MRECSFNWRRCKIASAIRTLSPPQRQAIQLAYFEGYRQSQIAAQTRMPLGTVQTRIRTALERLRESLLVHPALKMSA